MWDALLKPIHRNLGTKARETLRGAKGSKSHLEWFEVETTTCIVSLRSFGATLLKTSTSDHAGIGLWKEFAGKGNGANSGRRRRHQGGEAFRSGRGSPKEALGTKNSNLEPLDNSDFIGEV